MLIDKLHQLYPYLADLRMREIRVDKRQRRVYCTLSYPPSADFDNALKARIVDFIRGQMPVGYYCSVKFAEDVFTEGSFTRNLVELIKNRYPIYSNLDRSQIEVRLQDKSLFVSFNVGAVMKKNLQIASFCEKLSEYYAGFTSYDVKFSLVLSESENAVAKIDEQEKLVQLAINKELLKPSRHFTVLNQKVLFGKKTESMPMYISDLRNPMDNCTICGTVSAKTCKQAKSNPLLQVCSFKLTDGTGSSLDCLLFVRMQITDVETIMNETGKGEAESRTIAEKRVLANKQRRDNILGLAEGSAVVVRGKVVAGRDGLEMHVYDLCTCLIEPISAKNQFKREAAAEYLLVKPEEITEYRQLNFTETISETSVLSGETVVVLHVNATGLGNFAEDKLFAICGVKLTDGHLRERFFTYVNPETVLEEKALNGCGIASSQLIFYPTLTEIISDLYKFTRGAKLVGNDLPQIVQLLDYYAAPMDYRFDNEIVSQSDLLSALLENSVFHFGMNVAKIDDVAKKCKVACPSNVFCKETALTVARAMSYLSYNSK